MQEFQNNLSAIILEEIALEGLDGITIEALWKRLLNNCNWPLKPLESSEKKIVWSFIVCLKNIEFYKLDEPRDPLIIFNRFEYINSKFGSLYEPENVPKDIYPNYPIEDGSIMGSCKEYFTRLNLGFLPRKISVEEADKRWGRHLVIVANQEVRTKVLIPEDKQYTLNITLRYYLLLERIGRSRHLGEASFGAHSLKVIYPDSKALSYMRNRLSDDGLIKNQTLAFYGRNTQLSNRIVISSLVKFFVKRQSLIEVMVSRIVDYLKSKPNLLASYDQVKADCNISVSKTFKQPYLKKFCDTNLMLKYRELYPNATENEYLYKKVPKKEKVIRCIKLKNIQENELSTDDHNTKMTFEGREFKQDSTFERQILRWIEKHGNSGVTLSDISRSFRFTTDGCLEGVLKKLTNLEYITKSYCDRGRTKVFSYVATSICSACENDNIEVIKHKEQKSLESNLTINSTCKNDDIEEDNFSVIKHNKHKEQKSPDNNLNINSTFKNDDIEVDNFSVIKHNKHKEQKSPNNSLNINSTFKNDDIEVDNFSVIKHKEQKPLENNLNETNESMTNTTIVNMENVFVKEENEQAQLNDESCKQCDIEQAITRVMEHGYCKLVYENSKQTISLTDRFFFRQQIIFSMLSTENIISLLNIKKNIIATEKENPKFIGTLDIKTLIKIIGYFEKMAKLKSIQYRVTYGTKTVNYTFVGIPSVDFTKPEVKSYMNSFLNRFNNTMKTTKANQKWNLVVYKSPEPKINISELKLPRFMKMRSLHEYLYYIVYDHPGDNLINACKDYEVNVSSYRGDILKGDKAQLPKVYYPSINWKMFVPPLPKYPKYPDGWFFVSDIIHHMPLDLMLKIVNFNKYKVNLDKLVNYATHPVFKYLPLMALSSEVHSVLSQGLKKHILNTLNVLRLLCMIGLIQFGQKTYKDTELIYAYLNRRASLLNTVKSNPNYYRVSDMDYEQRHYEFFSNYELETYWLDTWYFCTNTPLGYRLTKSVNNPKQREINKRTKVAIEKACVPRIPLEAVIQDDGTIPGDNKGAAGFDSHLFAHLSRNWNLRKKSSVMTLTRRRTKLNFLIKQRMKKNINKKSEKKKTEMISNQKYKVRFKWTPAEDQILLFWKLGTRIIKQVKSHAFISYGIKDVIKSVLGKYYRTKSIDNYLRRIRYLMRFSAIDNNMNLLLDKLKINNDILDLFKNDFENQLELYNMKKYKAMRDLIVLNIKQFIVLLRERGITIDTRCIINKKKKTQIAQPIDIKQELLSPSSNTAENMEIEYCDYFETIHSQQDLLETDYTFTENEIYLSVISSLIHSSLSNQSSDPRISLNYLQAFKEYPEDILKQSFNAIKESNIITCSQYHKESLQIVLSTSHIIQSKTYDYGPKFSSILVGDIDTGRYRNSFMEYSNIKNDLSERKIILLYPSCGLCTTLTSLSLRNIVDLSIEFDKKYLEYMPNENFDEGSKCLKNTLKRMRSRHFDLLSTSNNAVEYIKIITSVTKQLKHYQVICKLKQSILHFEKEIGLMLSNIFKPPTFKPQLVHINELNNLWILILEFCKTKEQFGASQQEIKKHFEDLSLNILIKSLKDLINKDLLLRAGIEVPVYVHYKYANYWLVKVPNSSNDIIIEDENDIFNTKLISKNVNTIEPPLKKICKEYSKENTETLDYIKIRPWTRLDLTINKECLEKFLNSILSKIIVKPGIYLKTLKKQYYPILQPLYVRELVEILETMKCIKMIHMKNICRPSFFSDPSPINHNIILSDVKGLEDESLIMLEPTLDCEIRFGYFSNKFSYNV